MELQDIFVVEPFGQSADTLCSPLLWALSFAISFLFSGCYASVGLVLKLAVIVEAY